MCVCNVCMYMCIYIYCFFFCDLAVNAHAPATYSSVALIWDSRFCLMYQFYSPSLPSLWLQMANSPEKYKQKVSQLQICYWVHNSHLPKLSGSSSHMVSSSSVSRKYLDTSLLPISVSVWCVKNAVLILCASRLSGLLSAMHIATSL